MQFQNNTEVIISFEVYLYWFNIDLLYYVRTHTQYFRHRVKEKVNLFHSNFLFLLKIIIIIFKN